MCFVVIWFLLDTMGMRDTKSTALFYVRTQRQNGTNQNFKHKKTEKMKTKFFTFAILAMSVLFLSSCKDDTKGPSQKKLTKSTWTMQDGDYSDRAVYTLYFKTETTFQVQICYYEKNEMVEATDIMAGSYHYNETDGIMYGILDIENGEEKIKYKGIFMDKTTLLIYEYSDEDNAYEYMFTFNRQ